MKNGAIFTISNFDFTILKFAFKKINNRRRFLWFWCRLQAVGSQSKIAPFFMILVSFESADRAALASDVRVKFGEICDQEMNLVKYYI